MGGCEGKKIHGTDRLFRRGGKEGMRLGAYFYVPRLRVSSLAFGRLRMSGKGEDGRDGHGWSGEEIEGRDTVRVGRCGGWDAGQGRARRVLNCIRPFGYRLTE